MSATRQVIVGAILLAILLVSCADTPETPEPEPVPEYWGHPDLVIRAFIPPVILAGEGNTIYLSDLIENIGTNVSGATVVRYYITTQSPVDVASAPVIGERSLPAIKPGETDDSMEQPFVIPVGAGHLQFDSGAIMPIEEDIE